jgi:hypothetical protein
MDWRGRVFWATTWAAAFGVVEAAVVVYLRTLVYGEEPMFPLREIDARLMSTEIVREVATIVMLLGVAKLAAARGMHRFAVFALCFGVWDIVYYLALAVFIGWPAGLMDWDVLFLIPVPWTAPVLAPVLVSCSLIGSAIALLAEDDPRRLGVLRAGDWALEVAAGLAIIAAFLWNDAVVRAGGTPEAFPWWLFLTGWLGGTLWFAWRWRARGRHAAGRAAA